MKDGIEGAHDREKQLKRIVDDSDSDAEEWNNWVCKNDEGKE